MRPLNKSASHNLMLSRAIPRGLSRSPGPLPFFPSVRTWTIPQPMPLAHLNSDLEPRAIFLEVTHCAARRSARLRSRMSYHLPHTRASGSSARGGTKNRIFSAISVGRNQRRNMPGWKDGSCALLRLLCKTFATSADSSSHILCDQCQPWLRCARAKWKNGCGKMNKPPRGPSIRGAGEK